MSVIYAIYCRICGTWFYIHKHCFRGHAYCSDDCRQKGRRQTSAKAKRKYRSSAEARLDLRDAQRERRKIQRANSVGDQSSIPLKQEVPIKKSEGSLMTTEKELRQEMGIQNQAAAMMQWPAQAICQACGELGGPVVAYWQTDKNGILRRHPISQPVIT
jgi:hypothetical protein